MGRGTPIVAAGSRFARGPRSAPAATSRRPLVPGGTPWSSRTSSGSQASEAAASHAAEDAPKHVSCLPPPAWSGGRGAAVQEVDVWAVHDPDLLHGVAEIRGLGEGLRPGEIPRLEQEDDLVRVVSSPEKVLLREH